MQCANANRFIIGAAREEASAHFICGTVGECDGDYSSRLVFPLFNEMDDTLNDDARLSRTRSGEDKYGVGV